MRYHLIVAHDLNGAIGKDGKMPWQHLSKDIAMFTKLTKGEDKAVVMGRRTWESLPDVHRPLKGRVNIVVSSTMNDTDDNGCEVVGSLIGAIIAAAIRNVKELWIIGGSTIYQEYLSNGGDHGHCCEAYVTKIESTFDDCDVFFPLELFHSKYEEKEVVGRYEQDGVKYSIAKYTPR